MNGIRCVAGFFAVIMSHQAVAALPVVFDVSVLDGSNGFTASDTGADVFSGRTVSGAGDINDDGIADVIIGEPGFGRNGFADGRAYIIFGTTGVFPANLDLSTLDGSNGFAVTGTFQLAESVSHAGDINHDGIDDVIISETFANAGRTRNGRAFVVFGRNTATAGNFAANINVPTELNGSNGFELIGALANDVAGWSVSGAGDVNGDGMDDLIIGAPHNFLSPIEVPGRAYVVYGRDVGSAGDFPKIFDLATLDGGNGFIVEGTTDGDGTGGSVSEAGDVNGDGVGDLIVGTRSLQPRTYVVFGRNTASQGDFPVSLDLANLNGGNGFVITGDTAESVGAAGDVNQDGIADLIIGQPASSGPSERGRAYIVYGKDVATHGDFNASFDLSDLNGTNGFKLIGVAPPFRGIDGTGQSVAGIGDVNNDGIDDVGIKNGPFGQDETYVVFGRDTENAGEFPAQFNLSDLAASDGFIVRGTTDATFGPGGPRVAGAGDVNDDGIDDLIIGSPEVASDTGERNSGQSYILLDTKLRLANELVDFQTNPPFNTTSDTHGCPASFVGKFTFDATLRNESQHALSDVAVKVDTLTRGNLLLTDEGLKDVGDNVAVSPVGDFADGILSPGETVDVPFTVCLKTLKRFRFIVDVLGEVPNDQ